MAKAKVKKKKAPTVMTGPMGGAVPKFNSTIGGSLKEGVNSAANPKALISAMTADNIAQQIDVLESEQQLYGAEFGDTTVTQNGKTRVAKAKVKSKAK